MFKYLKELKLKFNLSQEITKNIHAGSLPEPTKVTAVADPVEFEIPENAQYNPRIPELVHGNIPS